MRAVGSIIGAANRGGRPLNVLGASTHERTQSNLARTGHQFYFLRTPQVKDWDAAYARLPANIHLLDKARPPIQQLPPDVRFDLVMAENRFGAYQLLAPIANHLQVPLLTLEHTLAYPQWPAGYLAQLKALRGHVNVFISAFSREKWGWSPDEALVVHHGVDAALFSPGDAAKKGHVLSVVNDFRNRDFPCGYSFWEEATRGLPRLHVGASPDGWSSPAKGVDDLVRHYRECAVFVDTAGASPIPTVLLEAMSSGCICVSRGNAMVPEIIQDGVNGFIREDPKSMRELLRDILANPDGYDWVRSEARKTIVERFSLGRFVADWDRVLRQAADTPWSRIPLPF